MLKWNRDGDGHRGRVEVTLLAAWFDGDNHCTEEATPADIVQCLKANPEACAEVTEALHGHWKASALAYRDERDAANARAERSLATLRELIHTASGLDEDSGGSGAASNPGEAASAIGDNGPEPAGREPQAPVTRAEVEAMIREERERVCEALAAERKAEPWWLGKSVLDHIVAALREAPKGESK